ncbi:SurA N-terminal domain-containing protein [Marinicella sediminis]|uniref:Periplasmic chaperone PpiD n=1 Tax=Marinicella sediminis TaxID=1792834 RepID=A0ABV7JA91_9GAMM|nr:SurA N-terminal domain-containing protein [Marinicella sediminis]
MLTWIRKKSSGVFMTVVMGILILAFALWGVGDYFAQSSNDTLATVNGETITYTEFNSQFNTYRNNMLNQFGEGFDPSFFDTPMMRRNFLESMINNALVKQLALDNGYTITEAEIRETIEQAPAFQDANGQFDKSLYAAWLVQTNQSAQMLQMKLEEEQAGQVLNELFNTTAFVTPFETNKMVQLNKQTRDFDYITVDPAQFIESIELSEEEITAYYDENAAEYMTEEQVSVNYLELNAADVAMQIEIDEAEALQYFESDKARFQKPEQRLASHILINDDGNAEAQLQDIQDKLAAGEAFAELAEAYSQDPGSASSGGDLGWVSPDDMVDEFEDALFAMEVGSVSEPVKSQFGYHLIQLNDIRPPSIPVYEEVKFDIIQELQASQSENVFLDQASLLSEQVLDAGAGLDAAAEATGLSIQTTEFFGRSGGVGLAANPEFINAAFSSIVKDELLNSDVINISDTHIVFLNLSEVKEASLKPLEEVRESIVTALKNDKAADQAREMADAIMAELETGDADLTQAAADRDLEVQQARDIARTGSSLPFSLVKNVFEMGRPADDVTAEVLESNGNELAVVHLLAVNDVNPEEMEDKSTDSAQLSRNIKNNEQVLLLQALRESASVTINEDLLNQSAL